MYYIMLDTETANDIESPFVYDVGFAVIDENGNFYEKFSFVNADIFNDSELMDSAYYKDKIPQYIEDIAKGHRNVATLEYIESVLKYICNKYHTKTFVAHNARFDYKSLSTTKRYQTTSKQRFFFPYGSTFIDTLKLARLAYKDNTEYHDFCVDNNYLTKYGKNRYTAEILYRFITGSTEFQEEHKGLDDAEIEAEIFWNCLKFVTIQDGELW